MAAPLGHIPLHIKGGNIIPTQEPGYTTTESRKNPFGLLVALDAEGTASGKLYLDDGESVDVEEALYVDFVASKINWLLQFLVNMRPLNHWPMLQFWELILNLRRSCLTMKQ